MDSNICNEIIGSKFFDILFQPTKNILSPDNMFIINFVKEKKIYSLHVFCFLRIMQHNKILLTSSDEFLDCNYKILSEVNNRDKSLLLHNIAKIKETTLNSYVVSIDLLDCGDFIITLSDQIIIEVRPDCQLEGYEHFRLFEYKNYKNKIVVSNKKNLISFN